MKKLTQKQSDKLYNDLHNSLNDCERTRCVQITSFEFDDSKWGPYVATRTVDKRVILATAQSGPAAKKYYGRLSVEADRFNPAEIKLLRFVARVEEVEGKRLHYISKLTRNKAGKIDGLSMALCEKYPTAMRR